MIIVVDFLNADLFPTVKSEVLRLRGGSEKQEGSRGNKEPQGDVYDDLDPAYVVCLSEEGQVMGATRLLQTMGPHMLCDTWSDLIGGELATRSALLWEVSCFDIALQPEGHAGALRNLIAAELMIGALEYAIDAGISDLVMILEEPTERLLRSLGCKFYENLGRVRGGRGALSAALVECSENQVRNIRVASGIAKDVFVDERHACEILGGDGEESSGPFGDMAGLFQQALEGALPKGLRKKLEIYCAQQLLAARTERERQDALALIRALSNLMG